MDRELNDGSMEDLSDGSMEELGDTSTPLSLSCSFSSFEHEEPDLERSSLASPLISQLRVFRELE